MPARWFGAPIKRKEDPAFLCGRGRYVDDIHLPGMLEAAFVRSPFAHARISRMDTSAARDMPGVHAIFTHADLPSFMQSPLEMIQPNPAIEQLFMPYILAKDEVCFAGEAVVLVIAENRYLAEDAASAVEVEYEPLPAVSDCLAGLGDDSVGAHLDSASNVLARMSLSSGDSDAEFGAAAHVYPVRILVHRGGAFSMECRGVVANWNAAMSSLVIEVTTQSPHRLHRALLNLLQCEDHRVRVVTPDVGGGFGAKGPVYVEYLAICAASIQLERPVKWIEDRRENFLSTYQERDQYWDVEVAVDADARIRGVRGRLVHDAGAYLPVGVVLPWISAATLPGPYVLPSYKIEVVVATTNKVPTSPVRGAGRPQAVVVMERLMDRIARELGVDKAEVRHRNMVRPEHMPYPVGILFRDGRPVIYDSGDYPACQQKALAMADYENFGRRKAQALTQGRYLGIGISNAVEATGLGPYEGATVRVHTNGKIAIYVGASSQGQAHKTTFAQIAADHFGVDIDQIEVVSGDTGMISQGHGTFGARMAVTAGSSVHCASIEVVQHIKKLASEILDVPESDLVLRNGRVEVVADRSGPSGNKEGLGLSLREVAMKSIGQPGAAMHPGSKPGLENTSYFIPERSTYANATHVVEVEVDIETGQVAILRYVVVHDCGRVINPLVVEGQIIGGVVHGIGNALMERMVFDEDAQPVSVNFGEYHLPLAGDVPHVELAHMETPSPLNPLGVKGAGEGGTIAGTAAVINAVDDALSPFGVWIGEAPISPQRIVALLQEAAADKQIHLRSA